MRAVLTRVSSASVTVDGEVVGAIDCPHTGGLLALVGISREDVEDFETVGKTAEEAGDEEGTEKGTEEGTQAPARAAKPGEHFPPKLAAKIDKMADKISQLRILDGEVSLADVGAPVLIVSQFTLYGRTAKGRRPSWSDAAPGELAEPVIGGIVKQLQKAGIAVQQGRFGAMMQVASVNEGPFTVLVEV